LVRAFFFGLSRLSSGGGGGAVFALSSPRSLLKAISVAFPGCARSWWFPPKRHSDLPPDPKFGFFPGNKNRIYPGFHFPYWHPPPVSTFHSFRRFKRHDVFSTSLPLPGGESFLFYKGCLAGPCAPGDPPTCTTPFFCPRLLTEHGQRACFWGLSPLGATGDHVNFFSPLRGQPPLCLRPPH